MAQRYLVATTFRATTACGEPPFPDCEPIIFRVRTIVLGQSVPTRPGPGRPSLSKEKRRVNISMSVSPATKALFDKAAKNAQRSRGEFLDAVVTMLAGFKG